jgi:hypothetical protein
VRAIDFHVHLPTPDWLDGSMAGYVEAAEAYFRSRVERQSLESLAGKYRALDAMAVLLAWDAETATGRPRVPNATVAAAVRAHPDAFTGIGSVDPHKESAVDEVAEIAALGLRGVKFHPSLQAFAPDDERFWPVFAACESHGLLALFHTGTSGIGARQPGGQGIRIDYSHPLKLDSVAAAFPRLTVVAAHFGWPWHMDLLAMALHKTNVYVDISGWSPKRIPAEVTRELRGRLAGQFVWGSDFPFIEPERCLLELGELGLDSPVLLRDNAARVLGLPGLRVLPGPLNRLPGHLPGPRRRDSSAAGAEGAAQVAHPGVGVLPGDEVAAVVVGVDVDVVEPAGLRAGLERADALLGGADAWRVLVRDEGEADRGLHHRGPVVDGRPGVAVRVGVVAHRRADGVVHPVDRGVGEQVVSGEDGLEVAAVVAPGVPALEQPGEQSGG